MSNSNQNDNADYLAALACLGLTHNAVKAISENDQDVIPFPAGNYKVGVAPSKIAGSGLLATEIIGVGEVVAPATVGQMRTPAGRYTNHSKHPNAKMAPNAKDVDMVASKIINTGDEITVDYRHAGEVAINVRAANKIKATVDFEMNDRTPELALERIMGVDFNKTSPAAIRQRIFEIEKELQKLPQVEPPLVHHFADGVYAREMTMVPGLIVVGAIHKTQHMSIVSQGDVVVATEFGIRRFTAPDVVVSEPGAKRILFAHTRVVWTTIHATEERDLDKLKADLVAPNYDNIPELIEVPNSADTKDKLPCQCG